MGELVHLRDFSGNRRGETSLPAALGAEILFFTGVRYHKFNDAADMTGWTDPRDSEGKGNSRKRKRRA